ILFGEAVGRGGDLAQAHDFVAVALDDDVLEFRRVFDATDQADAFLVQCAAHLADRGRSVLGAHGIDHVGHGYVEFAQLFRAQQHAQFALQRAVTATVETPSMTRNLSASWSSASRESSAWESFSDESAISMI